MIKAVFCDLDGTLIDSEKYYMDGTITFMKEFGFSKDQSEIYKIIGTTMDETYNILEKCLDYKVSRDKIIEANENYFTKVKPLDYRKIIFSDVKETLKKFKEKGFKLALCSQSNIKILKKFIEECELEGFFGYVESGEDIARPKPFPDIYLNALQYFGLDACQVLVYEDSELGIKAGKDGGFKVVARKDDRYGVNQKNADYIVNNINDLFVLVENLNNEKK